jgi:hypothetical protein
MHNKMVVVAICFAAFAVSAAAQVTGSGTSGTMSVFTGSTTVGNSPIVVSGRKVGVPTKVTTENGPSHRGDLLVTSSSTGYAMKRTDRHRLIGAVIDKAMGSLDSGTGVIEVLVTLQ